MQTYFVYVTTQDEAEAGRIAHAAVEERLAACANLLGEVASVYRWKGEVCEAKEAALVMKTSEARKAELIRRVRELHSYDTPCIVCLPVADGHPGFLNWIKEETAQK
jgi:periplasmic divalent cation tolerance protein